MGKGESSMSQEQRSPRPRTEDSNHALLTKAKSQGRVRVIVRLRLGEQKLETTLADPAAVTVQCQAIACLQDRLLQRMESFSVTSIRRFEFVPQVAMEVEAAGMSDLLANPEVVDIAEDKAEPPTASET
jgi:hypothetical protein